MILRFWNKKGAQRKLKLALAEANARIAELEAQVGSLKARLEGASKTNLTLARRETHRRAQHKELAEATWPVYLFGRYHDCQTGKEGWAVTEMKITESGIIHRVVFTCNTEKAARDFARDAEAERDEDDG